MNPGAGTTLRPRARDYPPALRAHHGGPGEVVFASKAFPCTAAYRLFAEEGLSCDVASRGELFLALQAGIHPKVVQEQLGHSAIGVTMDLYSHVPQAVRRESASRIAGQ